MTIYTIYVTWSLEILLIKSFDSLPEKSLEIFQPVQISHWIVSSCWVRYIECLFSTILPDSVYFKLLTSIKYTYIVMYIIIYVTHGNALFYKRHSVILRISSWKTLLHIILPIEKSQSIQIFQKSIQFLTKSSTGWDNPSVIYVLLYCNVWALLYDKVKTQNKNLKLPIP